jgi:CRP-like cAMP-binding protein
MSKSDMRRSGQAPIGSAKTVRGMSRSEKKYLVETLGEYAMFERCTPKDLTALVDAGEEFIYPADWALMLEHTPADACYAIVRGQASVYRDRQVIAELGPGAIIGEMAVLTGQLRRATVTSTTTLRGLRVENAALTTLFGKRPQLLDALRGTFQARIDAAKEPHLRPGLRAAYGTYGRTAPTMA